MSRVPLTFATGMLLATIAAPQDLPPGALLLSKVQRRVRDNLARLPNVNCLQTVRRELQTPRGKLQLLDTVRLEVLASGEKEFYAAPGERKFTEGHPIRYVGGGTMGDGFLGPYLKSILLNRGPSYEYRGEEEVAGRTLARWAFRIPLMISGQTIALTDGSGRVGLGGSFWADPKTEDLVRVEAHAEDFPPTLPLTEATWIINYARTELAGGQPLLLAQSAEFHMAHFDGVVTHNFIDFTHCRIYGAESAIHFDNPDVPPPVPSFGAASVDDTVRPLPGGLRITVSLNTPLTPGLAVGTQLQGVVATRVPPKGKVVIPAGAPVRGRLRRMEQYKEPVAHFVVGLEFLEVEVEGIRRRFDADLLELDPAANVEASLNVSLGGNRRQSITLPPLAGVAGFFVRGARLDLRPGLRTVWKTRPADD